MIQLPQLPFANTDLQPVIDSQTIDIHYGKHHQAYVNKLNELISATSFETKSLEDIIASADMGPVFNNAAQVWNHTFYWNCLRAPQENNFPGQDVLAAIEKKWTNFDLFKQEFITKATNNF
jgi:superoxide dismutase, Fe-Mn family